MTSQSAILNWMLALPLAGAMGILALPESQARRPWAGARGIAIALALATLVVAGFAVSRMEWSAGGASDVQLVSHIAWLPAAALHYFVGVDGISIVLVLLTATLTAAAGWASFGVKRAHKSYFALLLFWLSATLGVLVSLDLLLWFIFMLLSLVPFYFLIRGWGGDRKEAAARRYFWFIISAASVLFIVLAGIHQQVKASDMPDGPFNLLSLASLKPGPGDARFGGAGFWAMLAAFGVLMAAVPIHRWFTHAQTESPTPVAMLLGSILQLLGAYGIFRIAYPLFPIPAAENAWAVSLCGAVTLLYASLAALGQKDLRRVVAYVSIAQMGLILMGIAARTPAAASGTTYLLIGHAVAIAMAIFITGMIRDRLGHSEIAHLGGLAAHIPALGGWSTLSFLAAAGLPGLSIFMGELLIVLGIFESGSRPSTATTPDTQHAVWLAALAITGMVLIAVSLVWTFQRIFLGAPRPEHSNMARLSITEKWFLALFGIALLVLGIFPMLLTDPMRPAIESWLKTVAQ